MKKEKTLFQKYKFFLLMLCLQILLFFYSSNLGSKAFALSLNNLKEMLSIIPPIFILIGLMDVWIPKETMMKYMGNDAGIKGNLFAFALGSFSAGPLYVSFPVAGIFLKKGVSLKNIFIFIGAWSTTKIPMMLFEITQLGNQFAVSRFLLNIIGIYILAWIMEKTTSQQEKEIMNQNIQKLSEKH